MNYITRRLSFFLLLMLGLLVFCLTTTPGLITLIKLANVLLPGAITVKHLEGNLTNHIRFDALNYADAQTTIQITNANISWEITLHHPQLIISDLHLDTLVIATSSSRESTTSVYHLPTKLPLNINIKSLTINQLNVGSFVADTLQLQAFYNHDQWAIPQFNANYAQETISLQAHGQLQQSYPLSATLRVEPLSSNAPGIKGNLTLNGDASLYRWQGAFTGLAPIKVSGTLSNKDGKTQLASEMSWGANTLNIQGCPPNQLKLTASIPHPEILHPSIEGLQTKILANGTIQNSEGALTVIVEPGIFHMPTDSAIPPIPFQGGHLLIKGKPGDLQATGVFTLDRDKIIDFAMHLPNVQLKQITSPTQIIDGKLNFHINSLDFLQGLSKDIQHPHGQLLASISALGTVNNPDVQGTMTLSNAGLTIPSLGLTLNPIQAVLTSHNKQWSVQGSIREPSGHVIDLKGQGNFSQEFTGVVNISGDNFPAVRLPEYLINVSPQLKITIQPNTYDVTGTILVPTVQLKLMTFSNTVNLTDDAVFVQDEVKKSPTNTNINADLQIKMGNNVAIDVQGLQGFLDGTIQVKQVSNSPMTAIGELTIRDGTYKAYGQDLGIDHGKLLFTGGNLTNPDINLRATRKFNNTSSFTGSNQLFDFNAANLQTIDFGNHLTVGVQVAGHLYSPQITLFSIPARLSQADILSMLLLGKPANQASQSGGQLLLTAISAMNLDSGTKGMQLLSQLKETLGLDFNLQTGSQFNQKTNQISDNNAVVVGKSLTKRLYLSYNMGLSQEDSNVLTLKYLLNKYFSLQVTASDAGNGLDVLYNATP